MEDHVIKMQKYIGRLEGKVDKIAESVAEIRQIIAPIGKHEVRVEALEKKVSRHSEQIGKLEEGNTIQKELNVQIKHHLANDVSVSSWEGQKAVGIVKWFLVIGATTLLNQLPRIIELFR